MTYRWTTSEWARDGETTEHRGYVADIWTTKRSDTAVSWVWVWQVKATDAVSEWPELQAYGWSRTRETAKRKAEAALRRAGRKAPDRNPNTGELNAWAV